MNCAGLGNGVVGQAVVALLLQVRVLGGLKQVKPLDVSVTTAPVTDMGPLLVNTQAYGLRNPGWWLSG